MICYESPLGEIFLCADGGGLTALRFAWQNAPWARRCADDAEGEKALAIACRWLDEYFSGREPGALPPVHVDGTDFQKEVWQLLKEIPYGKTATYGELAAEIARRRGIEKMSAQAVGQAVGKNRISLIIPCHRVIGQGGSLTGYAAGIETKRALLRMEGIIMNSPAEEFR